MLDNVSDFTLSNALGGVAVPVPGAAGKIIGLSSSSFNNSFFDIPAHPTSTTDEIVISRCFIFLKLSLVDHNEAKSIIYGVYQLSQGGWT